MQFHTTHTVTLRGVSPHPGMAPLAYADFDASGDFTKAEGRRDETVFLRSEDGGSALGYRDLREAVEQAGGPVRAHDLARALGGGEGDWVGLSGLPPGTTHPIVDYVYSMSPDGEVQATYTTAASARIVAPEDGNIATLDLNGDGQSDPAHDALVQLESDYEGSTFRQFCSVEDLTGAVRAAGGRVDATNIDTALRGLVAPPSGGISLGEFGHPVDGCSPFVKRTLRLDDQGLVMDFEVTR